ncbi:hemolysin secretion protein D [Novosphingobium marinum]|uniref:RND family efflux transporter MFP subunit n=1 Tax=Novosphingobium marinum TaxID=1514948 RepID=A0A7Y9XWA7_9SPHN|nr:efflux RND transporter periplasmic adaptor subunit [Novosphingobium marinum]NYH95712.1 RND family efflux transporter MFP subunit [Novosphingobium marinum]GGC29274.1 hemolysin secretion protein D [Novosphingobium marinum]
MNYDTKIESEETAEGGARAYDPLEADAADERRSRRRLWIGAAIVLAILIAMWFMSRDDGAGALAEDASEQAPVVTVVSPGRTTVQGGISATGSLAARRELPVGAVGEGGRVDRVLVDQGDWVSQGQVLAVIDRSVQTQQQAGLAAQVQVAQADAQLAQSNLDRALQLVERGFISKADVDRLTATRDAAAARVKVAQAQLAEMRERTARLNILAPAAGLLLERNIEPGQVVGPGSGVLFRIASGGEMELLAQVGEDDLAKLSVGASAEVTPVGSEQTFNGQIWQLEPTINEGDRQGTARIALPYDPALRPGGFASARINSGSVVAPMLPESALLSDDQGTFVYVVGNDGKVARRNVRTGFVTDDGITVIEGLNGTERIVLRAGGFLNPGQTVKPVRQDGKQG